MSLPYQSVVINYDYVFSFRDLELIFQKEKSQEGQVFNIINTYFYSNFACYYRNHAVLCVSFLAKLKGKKNHHLMWHCVRDECSLTGNSNRN